MILLSFVLQIVWDPVAKKWMNKDEDGDGGATMLVPPPKTSDVSFRAPTMEHSAPSQPFPPNGEDVPMMDATLKMPTGNGNMYKLPKGRSMRANYVDVMNPGVGKPKTPGIVSSTPITSPLVSMATSSPQLFVPAPGKSLNFNYFL